MLELKIIEPVRIEIHLSKDYSYNKQNYWKTLISKILTDTLVGQSVTLLRIKTTKETFFDWLNSMFKFKNKGFNFSVETLPNCIDELLDDEDFILSSVYIFINRQQEEKLDFPPILSILGNEYQFIKMFPNLEVIYLGSDGDSFYWVNASEANKKMLRDIVNIAQ